MAQFGCVDGLRYKSHVKFEAGSIQCCINPDPNLEQPAIQIQEPLITAENSLNLKPPTKIPFHYQICQAIP